MSDVPQRQIWLRIADEMGLELLIPECLKVNDMIFTPTVVLEGYGGPKGMVVFVEDKHSLEEYDVLNKTGYGFSVVELEANATSKDMKELLDDWGKQT